MIFTNLQITERGVFGKFRDVIGKTGLVTLNLTGEIKLGDGANKYVWTYKVDGFDFHYLTEFELERGVSSNLLPRYLKTRLIDLNFPEMVVNEFKITEIETRCRNLNLSPEKLYKGSDIYYVSNGVILRVTRDIIPISESELKIKDSSAVKR